MRGIGIRRMQIWEIEQGDLVKETFGVPLYRKKAKELIEKSCQVVFSNF